MDSKYIEKAHEIIDNIDESFIENNLYKLYLNDEETQDLRMKAQKQRREIAGDSLYVRGSLEYSNYCSNSCSFCGMAETNLELPRYEVTYNEAIDAVEQLLKFNVKQLHIVTGENWDMDLNSICNVVKYATSKGMGVTMVLGELNSEDYKRLYNAGANRYILKFETSNKINYTSCKSGKDLYERIANLFLLRDIGFKIGTGVISGLPGTSDRDLIHDLYVLEKIQPDMASVSVFSPNPQSKYAKQPAGDIRKTLNFVSLMRTMLTHTPIITCSSSFGLELQIEALKAGANLMSYHVTPTKYAKEFSMYTDENRLMVQYDHINKCAKMGGLEIAEYI